LKWIILAVKGGVLWKRVSNWVEVFAYYTLPFARFIQIRFRDGHTLHIPRSYPFESVAETMLLDAYHLHGIRARGVVVDIGASVGDFVLFASTEGAGKIYAFEPDPDRFRWLCLNVAINELPAVITRNLAADGSTIASICDNEGVDFMKLDCEGCEYEVILRSPRSALSSVARLAVETHTISGHTSRELAAFLEGLGFLVVERRTRGHGSYLFATCTGSHLGRTGSLAITDDDQGAS
jgi:hypothetical protein